MSSQQLIYASRPVGFGKDILDDILQVSRARNAASDVTGALICRSDIFLQLLEGPTGSVEAIMASILADPRHTDVRVLVRARVDDRLFPTWAMMCDPAPSVLWSLQQVRDGVQYRATAREVRQIFLDLDSEVDL